VVIQRTSHRCGHCWDGVHQEKEDSKDRDAGDDVVAAVLFEIADYSFDAGVAAADDEVGAASFAVLAVGFEVASVDFWLGDFDAVLVDGGRRGS
jgi:hypothetical protein